MRKWLRVTLVCVCVVIMQHSFAQSIWYASGGTRLFLDSSAKIFVHGNLTLTDSSQIQNLGELHVKGDVLNDSENDFFASDAGLMVFYGSSSQSFSGDVNFHYLKIDNTSGVVQSSGIASLTSALFLVSGTLTSNDSFYLKSDSNKTARVAETTGGTTAGNFTVERYIHTGINNWRMISAPVQSTTLQDWVDDFYTSGYAGSQYPSFPFTSQVYYDETLLGDFNSGYVEATNATNTVNAGEGVWSYLGPLPLTFDAVGPLVHGTFDFGVTHTAGGSGSDHDGWNLLGNPYASTIDWDAAGWTKTNVNDAIYIWDGEAGQFRSYVNGVGTNGGTSLIPSSQAFYVQTNASSPVLECTEAVKSSTDEPFIYKSEPQQFVRFKLSVEGYQDETVVRFNDQASNAFDGSYDAGKTANQETYSPSLFTTVDSLAFSINTIPLDDEIEIPIHFQVNWNYTYDFEITEISNLPTNYCFQLVDLDSNETYVLDTIVSFQLQLNTGITYDRFVLKGKKMFDLESETGKCYQDSLGAISVNLNHNDSLPYQLFLNEVQIRSGFTNSDLEWTNLPAGVYEFKTFSQACGPMSWSIEIDEIDSLSISQSIAADTGNSSGSAVLHISGGTAPYHTFWFGSLSSLGDSLVSLWADTFDYQVIDANLCSKYGYVVIPFEGTNGEAEYGLAKDVLVFPNPAKDQIQIKNLHQNAMISIYDDKGVLVMQTPISKDGSINIADLNAGMYLITIQTKKETLTSRFTKLF